jgi:hypothetical protein
MMTNTDKKDHHIKEFMERKKKNVLLKPWTLSQLQDTRLYASLILNNYKPGFIVIDMLSQFDALKMNELVKSVKSLQGSLVSIVSRPPAFKEKSKQILKEHYKHISKSISTKKILSTLIEITKLSSYSQEPISFTILEKLHNQQKDKNKSITTSSSNSNNINSCEISVQDQKTLIESVLFKTKHSLDLIRSGSLDHVKAISHLSGYGTGLPASLKHALLPHFDPGLGFGWYFVYNGLLSILIRCSLESWSLSDDEALACYLECLLNILVYSDTRPFEILEKFKDAGGIDLLCKNACGLSRHEDDSIRDLSTQLMIYLISKKQFKRRCDGCGAIERSQSDWQSCSFCRYDLYIFFSIFYKYKNLVMIFGIDLPYIVVKVVKD